MRPRFELADVINRFGSEVLAHTKLTPLQQKVLAKIAQCRRAVERYATAITVVAIGTVQNVRPPNRRSGLTT